MRPKAYLFFTFLLCGTIYLPGQPANGTTEAPLLTNKDSLQLLVLDGEKVVLHRVKPKQTLYAITKYYGLSLEELYTFNPAFRTGAALQPGKQVMIPIPNKAIKRYKGKDFKTSQYVPIYYVVQQGDNLYQICKRHFDMPVDSIVKRNRLKNNSIRPGQLLLMGWMHHQGIPAEWRGVKTDPSITALEPDYEKEKSKHKEVLSQGVCFWHRDSKEAGDLYALHREAAIGTIIAVTNPMGNKTVFAKVIGRIPEGYERNIEIILSPEAARKIGARDPRFFVKIKYLK